MNCQKGDLAIIVRSLTGANIGKIVRCLGFAPKGTPLGIVVNGKEATLPDDGWLIDRALPRFGCKTKRLRGYATYVQDKSVRPLRDTPGEDETLAWAGKPKTMEKVK